jgi:cytochrome c2
MTSGSSGFRPRKPAARSKRAIWASAYKIIMQSAVASDAVSQGKVVFETTPCLVCHRVSGIAGNGQLGPDLTLAMST